MADRGVDHIGNAAARPVPRTELVGREDDLAGVLAAVGRSRLVTLTGPGGAGKTRLALAAAADLAAPAGVAWVELADVAEPQLVADTVRTSLGVPSRADASPVRAIVERLRDAPLVIALDNCEHLLSAAAELVDELLDGCPRLRVLATSREPLAVEGELVWPVAPLELPSRDVTTAAVRSWPAVRLFELRAQAALPAFRITDENAAALARLCRRLGGLPLAIELAAARVRTLSVAEITAGLDGNPALLSGTARGTPARQQSLRATLDWSHDLLSEPERIVFRRLGVFPGEFDLPAAQAVAAGAEIAPAAIVDLITRLVDRSLLTARPAGEQMRYGLLGPVRRYARRRLAASGEEPAVATAHLAHYADQVEQAEPLLTGPGQVAELDRLELEGNNLRAALAFAAAHSPPPIAGLRLAAGLSRLCALRGHYAEGRRWLDWAATVESDAPPALRAKALLGSGSLAHLQCDYPAAVRRLEAARLRYEEAGDRAGVAAALQILGCVARERGRYPRAETLHRESLRLAEQDGAELRIAQCHGYLGFVAWLQGHWADATRECQHALTAFRRLGDGEGIAWSLLSLGTVAQYQGELGTAADLLTQGRSNAQHLRYREGIAWTAHELGLLALRRGDCAAGALLREALARHRALGDRWRMASVLDDLAACAQARGDDARAVALLAAAAAIRAEIGTDLAPCERPDHDRVDATARARMGADEFARAWAHGQTAVLDDLLADTADTADTPRQPVEPQLAETRARTTQPDQLRVRVLGDTTVHLGRRLLTPADFGYAKPRELLFLLLALPPQSKAEIGLALWPDLAGSQLRNAFHTALRDLRRALGDPGWVTFSAGRYSVDRRRDHWCDLEIFEEALAAARQARPAAAALPHLQRAIDVYQGELGTGLPDAEWLLPRRAELAAAFAGALASAGRLLLAAGRVHEAIDVYRRGVAHDPFDESAHRHLMTALVRAGETGQAAQLYRQLADRLRAELGVAPAAQTRALYEQLSRPTQPR